MENNLKNKKKFFALYWGQKVRNWHLNKPINGVVGSTYMTNYIVKNGYLELKPLSSITDEDAAEVSKISGILVAREFMHIDCGMRKLEKYRSSLDDLPSHITDYLRSKGYALPYMGLSVEEQVSRGWVKLVGIPEGLYIDKNTLK